MRRNLFIGHWSRRRVIRLALLAVGSWLFFGHVCRPCIINGESMRPTYPSHGFMFCWKPAYWFKEPQRGDVVIMRYVGNRLMILKRLVALPGDTVEFRDGTLLINGSEPDAPWANATPCDWNLPPRTVMENHFYVVGDNRSMSMEEHVFGQIEAKRLLGAPLW